MRGQKRYWRIVTSVLQHRGENGTFDADGGNFIPVRRHVRPANPRRRPSRLIFPMASREAWLPFRRDQKERDRVGE